MCPEPSQPIALVKMWTLEDDHIGYMKIVAHPSRPDSLLFSMNDGVNIYKAVIADLLTAIDNATNTNGFGIKVSSFILMTFTNADENHNINWFEEIGLHSHTEDYTKVVFEFREKQLIVVHVDELKMAVKESLSEKNRSTH